MSIDRMCEGECGIITVHNSETCTICSKKPDPDMFERYRNWDGRNQPTLADEKAMLGEDPEC